MNERPDMTDWEDQINALMDGELGDAEAEALKGAADNDQALARAIIEAYQLQQALASIPLERAPASLRRKLKSIPREQRSLSRPWLSQPGWVAALAAVPLVLVLVMNITGSREPTEAEIAQARQDLALALGYLYKASRKTGLAIESSIEEGLAEPVTESTVRTLNEQLDLNKEQEA